MYVNRAAGYMDYEPSILSYTYKLKDALGSGRLTQLASVIVDTIPGVIACVFTCGIWIKLAKSRKPDNLLKRESVLSAKVRLYHIKYLIG